MNKEDRKEFNELKESVKNLSLSTVDKQEFKPIPNRLKALDKGVANNNSLQIKWSDDLAKLKNDTDQLNAKFETDFVKAINGRITKDLKDGCKEISMTQYIDDRVDAFLKSNHEKLLDFKNSRNALWANAIFTIILLIMLFLGYKEILGIDISQVTTTNKEILISKYWATAVFATLGVFATLAVYISYILYISRRPTRT